jgi:hypothetical protein
MRQYRWLAAGAIALAASGFGKAPAGAQETALKAGVAVSSFSASGDTYWNDRLTTTLFGGHVRFRLGAIGLQPELYVVTKGGAGSTELEEEQMRIEYIEVPVLLVVPFQVGRFEPFAYGGPSVSLESRCRWQIRDRETRLRTNLGCDPPRAEVFDRSTFDFGLIGGGGVSYPVGAGRVMLEARHNWGLRNINQDSPPDIKNRTFSLMIGYTINWMAGS